MLNKVILIGNLGDDPVIRHTDDGKAIANMSVATSERWKSKDGEQRERTEWHRVVCFNDKLSAIIEKLAHKGSKVYVEGQLQTRKWEDGEGTTRYSTEIVLQGFNSTFRLLDSKSENTHTAASESLTEPIPF